MADNVAITPGTGATVAADDIGGVLHQRVKLSLGADGTANDASAGAGAVGTGTQRVTLASDDPAVTALQTLDNAISGNEMQVDVVTSALPTGAATAANQTTLIGHVDGIETLIGTTNTGVGAPADAAWTSGNGSMIALLKASAGSLASLDDALEYETVAASQTDQMCGSTGAAGDYLEKLLIIPATTSPGAVSIEDGSTNTVVFTGGASSVSNLVPFTVDLGIASVSGGWEITTGANVSVIAFGVFT